MPRPHEATTPKTLPSKQRLKSVRELIYKRGYGKLNKQTIPLANNKVIEQGLGAGEDDIAILACLLLLGDSLLLLLEVNSRRLLEVGYSGLRMRAERLWKAKKAKDSSGPVLAGACGQGRIGDNMHTGADASSPRGHNTKDAPQQWVHGDVRLPAPSD